MAGRAQAAPRPGPAGSASTSVLPESSPATFSIVGAQDGVGGVEGAERGARGTQNPGLWLLLRARAAEPWLACSLALARGWVWFWLFLFSFLPPLPVCFGLCLLGR